MNKGGGGGFFVWRGRGGGGWGGGGGGVVGEGVYSHIKGLGCSLEILKLKGTPKRYQDYALWAWLENLFHPLKV